MPEVSNCGYNILLALQILLQCLHLCLYLTYPPSAILKPFPIESRKPLLSVTAQRMLMGRRWSRKRRGREVEVREGTVI